MLNGIYLIRCEIHRGIRSTPSAAVWTRPGYEKTKQISKRKSKLI